ncbi:predicted protein [Phaeodactylum tricornutum CCAP 1055/1]|uniref:Uncharacterized protein n=2 Tax=Phaeodactylum tricornutum TaxID=2850 RepID=B7G2G2_PHATC|nr:predicted protein [Phaeodactylum tricornutum CCAP 1055/1]EEC47125.1 predicted protein [Phaeodactylum tricornutum CCAP 1055/1]|eukprot:XP_002181202.1 predicted protein [Phaeodactylum tricornutum CCAP 1055/1]
MMFGNDQHAYNDGHDDSQHHHAAVPLVVLRQVPPVLRYESGPIEATGLAVNAYARGTVLMSSLFLGPALLKLASEAADCHDGEDCSGVKIYGFRPSSILTNIAIASGLLGPILMPIFGAFVDHTRYRKEVGAYSAAGLTIVKGIEIFVGPKTWFYIALLQVLSSVFYNIHVTATYAYTSELTRNANQQADYNAFYMTVVYVSTLLFMAEVILVSRFLGTDDVGTARVSQTITALTSAPIFYLAWSSLFREKPALNEVPPGMNLLTCGIQKVCKTASQISSDFEDLKWLLLSIVFAESGMSALITISTTYMTQVLNMSSSEIGVVFFTVIIMGVPGSKFGAWIGRKFRSPLVSAKLGNLFFILFTTAASIYLRSPNDKKTVAIFGALWGLGIGWLSPTHTTAFISIMPTGSEAELMGNYLVACQILSWLPPLVFTLLNENGIPMAFGLASLDLYFLLGLICLIPIRDYAMVEDMHDVSVPQFENEVM